MSYERSTRYPELFKPGAGRIWWAFLPNPGGRRLRESTGHTDDHAAYLWYLERVRKTDRAPDKNHRTLVDALDDRIEWLNSARASDDPTRKKLSADTIDFYVKKSRQLVRVLGASTLLDDIGHEQIRRYIATRSKETAKATTIAKELTALSMAMRLARKDGVACPVFSDILPEDFAAIYVPKTRWLPENEVRLMLEHLPVNRRPVFAFLVCTGATYPSEVENARPAHVKGHVVHLLGTKTTTRDRFVHVPSYGREFLKVAMRGLRSTGFESWGNVRRDLHLAARRAGIAAMSPNDLRRTFAQWLVRSGVPYELAAPMMGHGSTKMLEQVYGKRDAGAVAKLVEEALKRAPKRARMA